eukprot:tig00001095_g7018.t1
MAFASHGPVALGARGSAFLGTAGAAAEAGLGLLLAPGQARAAGSLEQRFAQNILANPGTARFPSELYYPDWFEGEWEVSATCTGFEAPQGEGYVDEETLRTGRLDVERGPVRYLLSFYTLAQAPFGSPASIGGVLGRRGAGGRVVGDRAANMEAITNAYAGRRIVRKVTYDPGQPTRLSVQLLGSNRCEIYLNKRAGEEAAGEAGSYYTSESLRQILLRAENDPRVTDYELLTRWRRDADDPAFVSATQKIAVYMTPLDGRFFETGGKNVGLFTYELAMRRRGDYDYAARGKRAPAPAPR